MAVAIAGGVTELTANGGVAVAGADRGIGGTADDSHGNVFAQLLEGLGVEQPATPAVTPMAAGSPGEPDKSSAATQDAANIDTQISTEMLALCGMAQMPAVTPSIPLLTNSVTLSQAPSDTSPSGASPAATSAATVTTTTTPTALANDAVAQPGTGLTAALQISDPDPAAPVKLVDVQWLQSMTGMALNKLSRSGAQSEQKAVLTTLSAGEDIASVSGPKSLPGHDMDAAVPQNLFQLLSQAAMMASPIISDNQRKESTSVTSQSDANQSVGGVGAMGNTQQQPTPVMMAADVAAVDSQSRHVLHAPVGSHQWATDLGNKLTLLAGRESQAATLYMTPAELGPVQVRIEMNQAQDQASVWFTAEHADTRSALEQSLPRLREMFSAQGMSLTDAGVFGNRSGQQQPPAHQANPFAASAWADDEALADTASVRSINLGLLNAYA